MKTIGLTMLLLVVVEFGAMARPYAPTAAPADFTTENYHLKFRIPANSFRCATPSSFVGSDHGGTIYLLKPPGCDEGSEVSLADKAVMPSINVFYEFNVVPLPGSEEQVPKTNDQIIAADCQAPSSKRPVGVTLFGSPILECTTVKVNQVTAVVESLYSQHLNGGGEPPDSRVSVTLATDTARLSRDIEAYKLVIDSLRVCATPDQVRQLGEASCGHMVPW